jgi:transcriptional regulator GlxA family with amidase domain
MIRLTGFVILAIMCSVFTADAETIGVLVFDGFLTSDVTAPIEVFGAAAKKPSFSKYKVVIVSATKNKNVVSEEGLRILADKTIYDDLKFDILVVPSSYAMDQILKNKELVSFVKKQSQSASWMASNCAGAFLLGEAGVLDGKHATTWAGGEKDLAASYPKIKVEFDKNVVVDDKVITSNGGPVSYQAAFELLAKLTSQKFADEISKSIQFNRLKNTFK